MEGRLDFVQARQLLLERVGPVGEGEEELSRCAGRILARDVWARESVPAFDRSPYDGYAVCSADTKGAGKDSPVTLEVREEVPAGGVPGGPLAQGQAVKVATGAPIPPGADGVVMFERTSFTRERVTLFAPVKPRENIVRAGEDVKAGALLARRGQLIDPGLAGTLAAPGITRPARLRGAKIAQLNTGSELVEGEETPGPGMIRNANRYTLQAAIEAQGCEVVYCGIAPDRAGDIRELLERALEACDGVVTTGGVSVGDWDLTPAAMEQAGVRLLFQGVDLKPGMACAYGMAGDKPVCALSGNPASAMTNFYAITMPALRKLAGWREPVPGEIDLKLPQGFGRSSRATRLLRGKLSLEGGQACIRLPAGQGNVMLSSAIGCDAMAIVPAGSGPVPPGAVLKGFLL